MNFCVIKRQCPLLESYKISVGDEIVVLTGKGLVFGEKLVAVPLSPAEAPYGLKWKCTNETGV